MRSNARLLAVTAGITLCAVVVLRQIVLYCCDQPYIEISKVHVRQRDLQHAEQGPYVAMALRIVHRRAIRINQYGTSEWGADSGSSGSLLWPESHFMAFGTNLTAPSSVTADDDVQFARQSLAVQEGQQYPLTRGEPFTLIKATPDGQADRITVWW